MLRAALGGVQAVAGVGEKVLHGAEEVGAEPAPLPRGTRDDTAREKPQQAKVVAVGRGRVNDDGQVFALDVKVGDTVLLGKYSGSEITVAGKDYVILREEEVLGVVEGVAELAMA